MTEKRSRSARHKRKRNATKTSIFPLLLGVVLILASFFLFYQAGAFNGLFQPTELTPTKSSKTQTQPSSSEEIKAQPTQEAPQTQADITWEVQETPVQVPILMYHAIHVMAPEEEPNANLIVDPATFESHLKALQDAGYYTLSPEEALKVLTENVLPQGKKVVWLTFDDSLWDFYDFAYPLLKQYNMKATNNVITGTVGNDGNLTLDEMKEMKENGISLQGHTVNHPDLEYSSIENQTMELTDSKAYLDGELAQDTIAVAYPAGRYSNDTLAIVGQANYKLGMTTNEGLASAANGLLSLNRVRMFPTTTAEILLQTIATE